MGAAGFRAFYCIRSCRMRFHLVVGTRRSRALIFERAEGTSKPGPPLAARNSSSMHGATPDGGSLLYAKIPYAADSRV